MVAAVQHVLQPAHSRVPSSLVVPAGLFPCLVACDRVKARYPSLLEIVRLASKRLLGLFPYLKGVGVIVSYGGVPFQFASAAITPLF